MGLNAQRGCAEHRRRVESEHQQADPDRQRHAHGGHDQRRRPAHRIGLRAEPAPVAPQRRRHRERQRRLLDVEPLDQVQHRTEEQQDQHQLPRPTFSAPQAVGEQQEQQADAHRPGGGRAGHRQAQHVDHHPEPTLVGREEPAEQVYRAGSGDEQGDHTGHPGGSPTLRSGRSGRPAGSGRAATARRGCRAVGERCLVPAHARRVRTPKMPARHAPRTAIAGRLAVRGPAAGSAAAGQAAAGSAAAGPAAVGRAESPPAGAAYSRHRRR